MLGVILGAFEKWQALVAAFGGENRWAVKLTF
jgi:hypothetical protein